jgi:hypothetical protein
MLGAGMIEFCREVVDMDYEEGGRIGVSVV